MSESKMPTYLRVAGLIMAGLLTAVILSASLRMRAKLNWKSGAMGLPLMPLDSTH